MDKAQATALYRQGLRATVKVLLRFSRANQRLQKRVAKLEQAMEEVQRSSKRQAAPFSKGNPKTHPKIPGRKPGADYGVKAQRPLPNRVDVVLEAYLPERCPFCGGSVQHQHVDPQYHTDIPIIQPQITQFNVHIGRCRSCGRRVQGRHPRQTSNALGAAASQVGPRALALAAQLNKGLGISFGKVQTHFENAFGLVVTRGGLCQGLDRLAKVSEPTYQALILLVRRSPAVAPDETGWRINGRSAWLHAFVAALATVYTIRHGRGFEEASEILSPHFTGALERDGWAPYRQFLEALHQTCLAHLDRRCKERLETAVAGEARFPHAVRNILQDALNLRDRREDNHITPHGLAIATGRLEARVDRLLGGHLTDPQNRTFAKHLRHERNALFTFLKHPGIEATNWRAEQAIRPAVVTRKVCGGNRSYNGAHTQEVLISLLRTCHQQQRHPLEIFPPLLCSPRPVQANLLGIGPSPPY